MSHYDEIISYVLGYPKTIRVIIIRPIIILYISSTKLKSKIDNYVNNKSLNEENINLNGSNIERKNETDSFQSRIPSFFSD